MAKMIVVADDFTGANDTGAQLAKAGANVIVSLNNEAVNCDVPVINTESRALSAELAATTVQSAIQTAVTDFTRIVYKKVDSTLRGNLGAEIDAAMKAFGSKLAVVAPAIPAAGRTTVNGVCLVNGKPVAETEFGRDPKTPVKFSAIPEIIAEQANCKIKSVKLSKVRSGQFGALLADEINESVILVVDAETDSDLKMIGQALATVKDKMVLAGAAGLAGGLPKELYCGASEKQPVLVLAGSMSGATQDQINLAAEQSLEVVDVNAADLLSNYEETFNAAKEQTLQILNASKNCAIRTSRHDNDREIAQELCRQYNLTGTELGDLIAEFLGKLGLELRAKTELSGMLLTGGDIAISMAEALGAGGYKIEAEVMPCIPVGYFTGDDIPVVTKAGGFGTKEAIINVIDYLQES